MITYDNDTPQTMASSATTSQNFTYVVNPGDNRALIVWFQYTASNAGHAVTAATYNGDALTHFFDIQEIIGLARQTSELWYLASPDTGSNTINVTLDNTVGAAANGVILPISYFGVDQSAVFDCTAVNITNSFTSNNSATTLTSASFATNTDNAWLNVLFYTFGTANFTSSVGNLRNQINWNNGRVTLVDRGPLTPTGSYSTKVNTTATVGIYSFTSSLKPAVEAFVPQIINFI